MFPSNVFSEVRVSNILVFAVKKQDKDIVPVRDGPARPPGHHGRAAMTWKEKKPIPCDLKYWITSWQGRRDGPTLGLS